MGAVPRRRRGRHAGLSHGAAAARKRSVHEPAGAQRRCRGRRRHSPQPAELDGRVVAVRHRPGAVLARRRLHLQLPEARAPRGAVPLVGRRDLPGRLPGTDGRTDRDPAPPRRPGQPQRRDRRDDRRARAGAALVGLADRALPARRVALDAPEARIGRLPARRSDAARPGRGAGTRRRSPAGSVLPAQREHRRAAGDRLHLRVDDPQRDLHPPAQPRRRLDRLLHPLGCGGAAPVDARTRSLVSQCDRAAHPAATGAAGRRIADRAGDPVRHRGA